LARAFSGWSQQLEPQAIAAEAAAAASGMALSYEFSNNNCITFFCF
jgi:hypothetical protein